MELKHHCFGDLAPTTGARIIPVLRAETLKGSSMNDFSRIAKLDRESTLHPFTQLKDFATVAKGLTSAYFPLSAAIVGEKVYVVIEEAAD
jgi:hypothetical protein